jgi:uncharacterized protein (TIGR02757 family)
MTITPETISLNYQTQPKAVASFFEEMLQRFKTPAFIISDPVSIVHRYHPQDTASAEVVALITCLMAYGQRPAIIKAVETLLYRLSSPTENLTTFLQHVSAKELSERLEGWYYRFYTATDMQYLLLTLGTLLRTYGSLEQSFILNVSTPIQTPTALSVATYQWNQLLRSTLLCNSNSPSLSYGCSYMFPNGAFNTSPLKRLYLFLKWMVRWDADISPSIDLGYWQNSISPKALIIPLDTHVHTQSLRFGLTNRKSKNLETALEITSILSNWCPEDPLIFDFVFMGIGTSKPTT